MRLVEYHQALGSTLSQATALRKDLSHWINEGEYRGNLSDVYDEYERREHRIAMNSGSDYRAVQSVLCDLFPIRAALQKHMNATFAENPSLIYGLRSLERRIEALNQQLQTIELDRSGVACHA